MSNISSTRPFLISPILSKPHSYLLPGETPKTNKTLKQRLLNTAGKVGNLGGTVLNAYAFFLDRCIDLPCLLIPHKNLIEKNKFLEKRRIFMREFAKWYLILAIVLSMVEMGRATNSFLQNPQKAVPAQSQTR